jgi:hypothetical protein
MSRVSVSFMTELQGSVIIIQLAAISIILTILVAAVGRR